MSLESSLIGYGWTSLLPLMDLTNIISMISITDLLYMHAFIGCPVVQGGLPASSHSWWPLWTSSIWPLGQSQESVLWHLCWSHHGPPSARLCQYGKWCAGLPMSSCCYKLFLPSSWCTSAMYQMLRRASWGLSVLLQELICLDYLRRKWCPGLPVKQGKILIIPALEDIAWISCVN